MAAPSENRALSAMQRVQALSAQELDELITREIGEPMLAVFSALAEATHPGAPREQIHRAVHLMVLSYLMRCETEH
jgi:predicted Fe-Mo cluster-binding NifX family protein